MQLHQLIFQSITDEIAKYNKKGIPVKTAAGKFYRVYPYTIGTVNDLQGCPLANMQRGINSKLNACNKCDINSITNVPGSKAAYLPAVTMTELNSTERELFKMSIVEPTSNSSDWVNPLRRLYSQSVSDFFIQFNKLIT